MAKYPCYKNNKATSPYRSWNNKSSWFIASIFFPFDRAFFLQDLTKVDNLQQWVTIWPLSWPESVLYCLARTPLHRTCLSYLSLVGSKNSKEYQVSQDCQTGDLPSITIMWLDVSQSRAEWWGLRGQVSVTVHTNIEVLSQEMLNWLSTSSTHTLNRNINLSTNKRVVCWCQTPGTAVRGVITASVSHWLTLCTPAQLLEIRDTTLGQEETSHTAFSMNILRF